ncbi:MAG: folate-binding protein YgfZ [Acidimicrobiales bacterium]
MIGYDELVHGVAAVRLERDVIRVSGPDAVSYLQGQLSQDVAVLDLGSSAWSLVLQPQGKVDAWLRVTRTGDDELVCDLDAGFGEALVARLARFKLRVKADIETLDWSCIALRGPAAVRPASGGPCVVASADWPLIGGYDLLGPDPLVPDQMAVADDAAYEVRRIEAGLPRMGAELTERTIPAEAGVVESSVSFTKGCYTGQELVARIDSRGGHVPRQVRGVRIDGPLPAVGTALEEGGREVGTLTSVAAHPDGHGVALAVVRRDVEPPAEATCGGARASIRTLPLTA